MSLYPQPGTTALAQWVQEQGDDGGYKVEFETGTLYTLNGREWKWWCEVRSIFRDRRDAVRVMGDTIDEAAQNALEALR